MTTINPGFNALNAYNRASGAGALGAGGNEPDNKAALGGVGGAMGTSFGDVLGSLAEKTINAQKAGEKASADAITGKADVTDVISAVNNAEMSLNMFLAIRDKMVDAYQRISQTQV
jgi:flagellar hook-basal body complex protein FliE